ncbi:DUF1203 domain-containing protein [Roseibium denhamense]|uniref:DUF1203 domain-containing protein n=1 Tax=Roseibium denhamense TaxID=76305 RepID=A0ABY1PED7_9HYPH|nr:DUF1203 domain-containing protein [Roseibium denhamense]MTI04585.1 DUF1203 domain-containing protein [Roseibium denhamense]SMP31160.1 Protein of unknown function [Roseibium denhamense]
MFQIHPLPSEQFAHLATLTDSELAARNIQVHISDGGFPCRVSLEDAPAGARVFLLNFEHQPGNSPYRSRHAIFVQEGAEERHLPAGRLPASITSRLLSVRAFNSRDEIVEADVIEGVQAGDLITRYLEEPEVSYIHLHFARRGCFAARVTRT